MNTVALPSSQKLAIEDRETFALFALGFRPFFLLAGVAAFVLVPAFLVRLRSGGGGLFPVVDWHVHEMLFGFTSAVVAGFLLTAAGNWTSERTLTGARLGGLAFLWLLGRAALVLEIPGVLASVIDLSFYPLLAVAIGIPILRAKNRRNYVFLALLSLLFAANLGFHLVAHGLVATNAPAKEFALRLYGLMLCLVAGRIVPMFTKNASGDAEIRSIPALDYPALGILATASLLDTFGIPAALSGALWIVAGTLGILRMARWGTARASASLLWVLHAGYALTTLSFVLLGLSRFEVVSVSAATHLFTLGGLGLLCFGMMTRVSLGHSGRMLAAPRRMTFAFASILAAALVRTAGPILAPNHYFLVLVSSACLWCFSAALFLSFGVPIWFSERLDRIGNYHGASLPRLGSK